MDENLTFVTMKGLCKLTGLTRNTIYRRIRSGEFPQPFYIGERSPRWRSDVVAVWMENVSSTAVAA